VEELTSPHAMVFVDPLVTGAIEAVREEWDPSMASAIAAHVTVAYPRDIATLEAMEERVEAAAQKAEPGDGGFGGVYERLAASVGEVEADAIFADAKVKLGTASLDDWLTEVTAIARERHPGVLPA
jgi:hypothetical protein